MMTSKNRVTQIIEVKTPYIDILDDEVGFILPRFITS